MKIKQISNDGKIYGFDISTVHLVEFIFQINQSYIYIYIYIYRVSQEECARFREGVPYAKIYRYNPKNLCPKWNGYGDNGQRILKL